MNTTTKVRLTQFNTLDVSLLLYPQNRVFCRLGDSEFDDSLGWNLDLLHRFGIDARACFPLLLYEFAKNRARRTRRSS